MLPVVYVYPYSITKEDELAAQLIDKGRPVNTFRLLLVSSGRIVRLAPSDETDAKGWEAVFHELMVNKYTKEEIEEKEEVRQVSFVFDLNQNRESNSDFAIKLFLLFLLNL